jgi:hypothetical protein
MDSRRKWYIVLVALMTSLPWVNPGAAVEESKEASQRWREERHAEFQKYRFYKDETRAQLVMELRSVLNWSNAERGADVGAVFLWTDGGRPELIASAFGRGRFLRHEFHSLSEQPLIVEREGQEIHRFAAGIAWQALAGAPSPAKQRPLRLTQMRRQAERFRVVMGGKESTEMRLLTQPVFRTTAELKDDTALFVFVQGTDPECVLLLQATGEGKWQYALTRQTKWALNVELDGNEVAEFRGIGRTSAGSPFLVLTPPAAVE